MICENCKYYDGKNRICRNMKARYVGCEECHNANPKPTNADLIRAMTDEELATWYWNMLPLLKDFTDSKAALLDWLKQEVEDG